MKDIFFLMLWHPIGIHWSHFSENHGVWFFVAKNTTRYLLSIWHMSGNQLPESIASMQTLEIFKGEGEGLGWGWGWGWGEVLWWPLTLEQCRKSFACHLTIPINVPHMYLLNSHNVTMLLSGSCTYWEKKILHGNIRILYPKNIFWCKNKGNILL